MIGATEKPASVGRTMLRNLMEQPSGATIYPINPHRPNVLGIRCYPNIASIGEQIDLAIVVTPAATVPEVLQECVAAGVRSAIVISAGFAELGAEWQSAGKQDPPGAGIRTSAADWAELRWRNESAHGTECDICAIQCPARQHRFSEPERRALHRRTGLEPPGERGI